MTERAREIVSLALELAAPERRQVIDELMASLEGECNLHPDWSLEIRRRMQDLENGVVEPVPWAEVRAGLLDRSRRVS